MRVSDCASMACVFVCLGILNIAHVLFRQKATLAYPAKSRQVTVEDYADDVSHLTGTAVITLPTQRSQPIPQCTSGGIKVLLVSAWRSGSSFVGKILSYNPDVFYMFEPLKFFDLATNSSVKSILIEQNVSANLERILGCDLQYLEEKSRLHFPEQEELRHQWTNTTFQGLNSMENAERMCRSKQHVVAKIIRILYVNSTVEFLSKGCRKVVYLIRDPRAMFASQLEFLEERTHGLTMENYYKYDRRSWIQNYCQGTYHNINFIRKNRQELLDKLHFVRFEDLAYEPLEKTAEMYSFTGFNVTDSMKRWLINTTSSKAEKQSPFDTERDSKSVVVSWRQTMSFELVRMIQEDCRQAMEVGGYKLVTSEGELRNNSMSLVADKNIFNDQGPKLNLGHLINSP